ncbi:MAG: FAD synthetase [Rikenellaceae bacterium]
MKLFRGIDSYDLQEHSVVTVGSFDGVHCGHLSLLHSLQERAKARDARSVVVSFSPHPRVTLGRAEGLKLLTSDNEKATLLNSVGIDALLLLEFNSQLSQLSYEEFVVEYLIKRVNMVELIVGFNHQLGHNGGSYNNLAQIEQRHNFRTVLAKEYSCGKQHVSSTIIRDLIEQGNLIHANELLSHNYPIFGWVNKAGIVQIREPLKLIPPVGEYRAIINGKDKKVIIDTSQRVWCDLKETDVEIRLLTKV